MSTQLQIQETPNPNALKFILDIAVKTEGNFTYKDVDECQNNPLAKAIFDIDGHVKEVYFFDNYITVTQDGDADWDDLQDKIQSIILAKIANHDPNFSVEEPEKPAMSVPNSSPEVAQIEAILNDTIRPALQMDGGDVQVVDYNNNVLKVFYQGACGSCPSSSAGTLNAIENILKDQFNPEIAVEMA